MYVNRGQNNKIKKCLQLFKNLQVIFSAWQGVYEVRDHVVFFFPRMLTSLCQYLRGLGGRGEEYVYNANFRTIISCIGEQ